MAVDGVPRGRYVSGVLRWAWLCAREARPVVQVIVLLRFAAGVELSATRMRVAADPSVIVAAVAWISAAGFIYLLNGVCDLEEDRANRSRRPLASGALPVSHARRALPVLAVVALVCAAVCGPGLVVLVVAFLALGWMYSAPEVALKRQAGWSTLVGVSGGALTYTAGYLAVPAAQRWHRPVPLIVFGTAMSLWIGIGGIAKDLSDVRGDVIAGRRSWPVVMGDVRSRSILIVSALCMATAFLCAARWFAGELVVVDVPVTAGAAGIAGTAASFHPAGRRVPYQVFMATQYLTHFMLLADPGT
jgi:4-hydroxybenzoate polyprenyltransferase